MFHDVLSESTQRIMQSTILLNQINKFENDSEICSLDLTKIQKGMFFVSLYASIEFTLTSCCSNFLAVLQAKEYIPIKYKHNLLCVFLDPEFKALADSKKKIWKKKEVLVSRIFSEDKPIIDNTVFPTDGTNIGLAQLQDVWNFLHLPGPVIPEGENAWYLHDIKEHRNAIAHGRMKAAEVGQRYTFNELEKRHNFVNLLCGHIVESFSSQVRDEGFLKEIV